MMSAYCVIQAKSRILLLTVNVILLTWPVCQEAPYVLQKEAGLWVKFVFALSLFTSVYTLCVDSFPAAAVSKVHQT
jgi:hypothetical protein